MLGPFVDRDGVRMASERWATLVESTRYAEVATTDFPALSITVHTTWLGHDPLDNVPPRIFVTRVAGEEVPEVATATLNDARNAHAMICDRFTQQLITLRTGGSSALREGTL